jgi:signal transduction histidine kinase
LRPFRRFGLPERLLAVLLLVALVDFFANTFLFERANSFELRRDDAERIVENLKLASSAVQRAPLADRPAVAAALSTGRFALEWAPPSGRRHGSVSLSNLRAQIVEIEPEFAHADLELHLEGLPAGGNIGGSLKLADNSLLGFRTHVASAWKLTAGRMSSLMLPTLLLGILSWAFLHTTLRPLRSLVRATRRLGSGTPQYLPERGPDELRELVRALNQMQDRIHESILERTHTMIAIGHDLKTPLARMRLRIDDDAVDPATRDGISHDIEEMCLLIESIQAYVESGGSDIPAQRIDIAVMAETLVETAADHGADARYSGEPGVEIMARAVSIRRALSNLIENALHYGGNVRVAVTREGGSAQVMVEDDGPGIPEDRIANALQPFVRLDSARARDTAGMGLGLPIVQRSVALEGGTLDLRNRAQGGLRATIRLPLAAN